MVIRCLSACSLDALQFRYTLPPHFDPFLPPCLPLPHPPRPFSSSFILPFNSPFTVTTLSTGAIIGIAVGVTVPCVLVVIIFVCGERLFAIVNLFYVYVVFVSSYVC